MKITICAYDAPGNIDGPSAWIKRLLPWLKNKDVTVSVIFFADKHADLPVYNFLTACGVDCRLIYWDLFQEEKIIALLRNVAELEPDVFIANYFPIACMAAKWIKEAGIPIVMVMHNDDDFHYALMNQFAKADRFIDCVVSVSESISHSIKDELPAGVQLITIPCGAPLAGAPVHLPAGETLKVIYAGRLDEKQKQVSALTRAFCLAAKEIPGTSYEIYGSGSALENVLRILQDEGKSLPVTYVRSLDSAEVLQAFLQQHVFVLLSDYEGIPISLMEAMGCGLVPVCTSVKSGVTEIITDKENGLLVTDREQSFVNAIRLIKDDQALHHRLSKNARETIEKKYSSEACNTKWFELLVILAAEKKYTGINIPALDVVKKYKFPAVFQAHANHMPSRYLAPLYKLKRFLNRARKKMNQR